MSAKPRSDSKLKSLPPHYKAELVSWLVDQNMSYAAAREKLWEKFSVKTSEGALSSFYATECFALRSSEALAFAEEIEAQLAEGAEKFDQATLALVKQKAFERAYAKNGSIDELAVLAKIIGDSAKLQIKAQELAQSERKLVLLEAAAALADQGKKVASAQDISPEEQLNRFKAIFGAK